MMFSKVDVRVVERWSRDLFDVYLFPPDSLREAASSSQAGTMYRYHAGDVGWTEEAVGEPDQFTGLPAPSFSIPTGVMEEILRQSKKIIPSLDREDAVTDARATRDRLLRLVEIRAVADAASNAPITIVESEAGHR